MRILFVWSSAEFATWDVARGYRAALERTGQHNIRDFRLYARMRYHRRALGDRAENINLLSRIASEGIIVEAMKHRADVVLIISGLALHPDALWYLRKINVRVVTVFTESPYNDKQQREFHAVYPQMKCLTTERTSATNGWGYIRHAYDKDIHKPGTPNGKDYDVLMIGTLWQERIQLLERIDWSGINVKFIGTWLAPPSPKDSSLSKYYEEGCIKNDAAPDYYASAKICLNIFRRSDVAESLNPRVYELAACKAFQLTDHRAELDEIFDNGVATFEAPEELEDRIRYWLAHENERQEYVEKAYAAVQPHTFDDRVTTLMSTLQGG